jgi:hypothetical protein
MFSVSLVFGVAGARPEERRQIRSKYRRSSQSVTAAAYAAISTRAMFA